MPKSKHRAFLKWAGGKYSLVEKINKTLPKAKTLVEPFVGAGSVFLNSDFEHYVLNDINQDLINLYKILQNDAQAYIKEAKSYFLGEHNHPDPYYNLREQFNNSEDPFERSVLFLYLNRHCYNGLCRYNSSGGFNVPFGRYKHPYFPRLEIEIFAEKASRAEFTNKSFQQSMLEAPADAVLYCDPPYAPLSEAQAFTSYAKQGFTLEHQKELAHKLAEQLMLEKQLFVLISNHWTDFTKEIYSAAKQKKVSVSRFISQKGTGRQKVAEILASYIPK